jgi:Phage tail baseplate hub (GPD)
MPTAKMRLFLDNAPASEEQLAVFGAIRIDQGIGMATEAQIDVPAGTDDSGTWQYFEDAFVQPFARVRVEIAVAEGSFVPLIDGPVVAQRFQLEATPESSRITLVVHDDSVLLNRDETVVVFEDKSPSEIAEQIFADAGLDPRVDAVPAAGSALQRFAVQRGTAMQMLRRLARDNGMFVYVEPGESAGRSVGVFQRPLAQDDELPDLVLRGDQRNIGSFAAEFDALRPQSPQASSVLAGDRSVVNSQSPTAPGTPLGPEAVHGVLTPAITLLARTREEQADIDAATAGAADLSSWAWTAQGEVHADGYTGVLRPYRKLTVRGVGGHLSGDYLISRVAHEIRNAGYSQQFSLTRNARGAGAAAAGGLPGGVF